MQVTINKPRFAKNASEEAIFRTICKEVNGFISKQKKTSKKGLVLKATVFSALFVGSYTTSNNKEYSFHLIHDVFLSDIRY